MVKEMAFGILIGTAIILVSGCDTKFDVNSVSNPSSGIIPGERRIDWNPGIPGGIPEINGPVENIQNHGADPNGVKDSKDAIVSAMNALPPEGGVVFIPAGIFRITTTITIKRNRIVFRGTGRKSKLLIESDGNCIDVFTYNRGKWQALPNGTSKGSISLVVKDGSLFTPGRFAEIEQDNDPEVMYTKPKWNQQWAEHSVGQLFEIQSVQGNEITFKTALNFSFSPDLNARIRPQGLIKHVGFEDLYIEKMVPEGHTFSFVNTAYCWIRNVESNHTQRSHVHLRYCLASEIRDSYFHRSFSYGGLGSGYGIECALHVTNSLVENNIFDSLRHAMLIHLGANGNVYGYNYSINPVGEAGKNILKKGWVPPDLSIHGHYPFMNLFEGNEVEEIGVGDHWGPAGPGNTYFRNMVNGDGILFEDESHSQNIIGNITTVLNNRFWKSKYKLEHGNVINGKVKWDPNIPQTDLPKSYYHDSVPWFFEDQNWPPFGPDIGTKKQLPAQTRLNINHPLNLPDPTPG